MNNGKIIWTTKKLKISTLKPSPYNPRELTEIQAKDLSTSLEHFNLADPIVINANNKIIGGHQRIKILQQSGDIEVDCRIPSRELTEYEEQELNLRLNKNLGQWDFDLLANFDEEMLKDVGFASEELDKIFQLETEKDPDEVPEVSEVRVKAGDFYQLGSHRLLCGDSTQRIDVERLMDGNKADMVFTDPPYNIGFNYESWDDQFTKDEYKNFCSKWMKILREYSQGRIILTIGLTNLKMWMKIENPTSVAAWVKKNAVTGSKIAKTSIWEPLLYFGDYKDRKRDFDVFEFNLHRQKIGETGKEHSCPKQVQMLEDLIEHTSKRDELWLDIFGGSGTTLIACERLNRKCYMMEIDPVYCQVIIDRWENYTNKKAYKL